MTDFRIRFGTVDWTPEDRLAVINLLDGEDPQLSMGPNVEKFEKEFAHWIGSNYAIAVSSGTMGLMVALKAFMEKLDIDGVATTALTYPATWNAAESVGLDVLYYDIDPKTYNMDMLPFDGKVLQPGLGLLAVSLLGKPLALKAGMPPTIEDACESLGSRLQGKHVGTLGVAGVFSFYPSHQMTTGEGGMIVTDDLEIKELCRAFRDNGRKNPGYIGSGRWESTLGGYNAKMTEIQGVIGRSKLQRLDAVCERRNEIFDRLQDEFSPLDGYRQEKNEYIVPLGFPIRVANQEQALDQLHVMGIEARAMFPYRTGTLSKNAKEASEQTIFVPTHQNISDEDLDFMVEMLYKIDAP